MPSSYGAAGNGAKGCIAPSTTMRLCRREANCCPMSARALWNRLILVRRFIMGEYADACAPGSIGWKRAMFKA